MTPESKEQFDAKLTSLLRQVAENQDKQAFAELFTLIAPKIKAFSLKGRIAPERAEEIVQEAMISVWRNAFRFDRSLASPTTWIFTIVRNKKIDLLRKLGVSEVSSEDLWPDQDAGERFSEHFEENRDFAEAGVSEMEHALVADREASIIGQLIEELPLEQRQVIQKVYFEEKSHSVVAEELGLALGTVKSRIRLAVAKLGVWIKRHDLTE